MDSLQGIKSRLKAVKSVGQITSAMEVVSATKMRRAQETALATRPYAFEALTLLARLTHHVSGVSVFTARRDISKTLIVIVSSDKGLAGSFNAQVLRRAEALIKEEQTAGHGVGVVAIGKRSIQYAERRGIDIVAEFSGFGDHVSFDEVDPLVQVMTKCFLEKEYDQVLVVSTHFRTALKQETLLRSLLPVDFEKITETVREIVPEYGKYAYNASLPEPTDLNREVDYIFEPSPEAVFEVLIPHLVRMQVFHFMLEANASEHSARRVAMKTASDNAHDLSGALELSFNKARQAAITKELIEITSTQNALS